MWAIHTIVTELRWHTETHKSKALLRCHYFNSSRLDCEAKGIQTGMIKACAVGGYQPYGCMVDAILSEKPEFNDCVCSACTPRCGGGTHITRTRATKRSFQEFHLLYIYTEPRGRLPSVIDRLPNTLTLWRLARIQSNRSPTKTFSKGNRFTKSHSPSFHLTPGSYNISENLHIRDPKEGWTDTFGPSGLVTQYSSFSLPLPMTYPTISTLKCAPKPLLARACHLPWGIKRITTKDMKDICIRKSKSIALGSMLKQLKEDARHLNQSHHRPNCPRDQTHRYVKLSDLHTSTEGYISLQAPPSEEYGRRLHLVLVRHDWSIKPTFVTPKQTGIVLVSLIYFVVGEPLGFFPLRITRTSLHRILGNTGWVRTFKRRKGPYGE